MKKGTFWIILLVLCVGLYAAWRQFLGPQQPETVGIEQPPVPAVDEEPPIRYPVPEAPPTADTPTEKAEPLPPLNESDETLRAALDRLFVAQPLDRLLLFDNFVRRVVATTDNLTRSGLPVKRRPTQSVPGAFLAAGDEENLTISPENARRYAPFIRLAQAAEAKEIVEVYARFYPLFQEAYQSLGYRGYFNDRLIDVIDHLLATPQVQEPVQIVRPGVLYQYADPELEALSSGQKLLIRIGRENAAKVKTKLGELRQELTSLRRVQE